MGGRGMGEREINRERERRGVEEEEGANGGKGGRKRAESTRGHEGYIGNRPLQ